MSLAQFNPGFPTLYVSGDFTDAAVIQADFENQWGFDFGAANTYVIDLWEGPGDSDDTLSMTITAGTPAIVNAFASAPAVGSFVYVIDFYRS
jgi:hypothetical protein